MRFLLFSFLIFVGCGAAPKSTASTASQSEIVVAAPKFSVAKIVAKYPHRADAYTQGLLWHKGKLYESIGQYGHSALRRVDLQTGTVELQKTNEKSDFGEGLAVVGEKLYQLTWQQGKAYLYSVSELTKIGTFKYDGEGWGLTSNADTLYMSDGSSVIKVVDPATFRVIRQFEVQDNKGSVDMLNELEWIDGKIWANVYTSPLVAVIDPVSGNVEQYIDCSALVRGVGNADKIDFLNGIAYDGDRGRIFLTGKLYDTLFEISL